MKKITKDGKVIWVKEEGDNVQDAPGDEDKDKQGDEGTDDGADNGGEGGDEGNQEANIEASAKRIARSVAKEIAAELNPDKMRGRVERYVDQPGNEKLRQILHGKDIRQDKDQLTKEEKIIAFFHALVTHDTVTVKALSEGATADGAALLPQDFQAELIRELNTQVFFRPLARTVTMRRNTLIIPNLLTPVKTYWTSEGAAKTTTTAQFSQLTLTAFKLAAILYATDELIEDSFAFDIVQLIITLFAESLAREEETAFMSGNGTTRPQGIFLNGNLIPTVACSGNYDFDDVINTLSAIPQKYRKNLVWVMNRRNEAETMKLKDSQNRYIWSPAQNANGSIAGGFPGTILGYPYYLSEDAPNSKIALGDWKQAYWIGERGQIAVKVTQDSETAFTQDKTAIRVVERIGGLVVQPLAARLLISIP